MDVPACAEEIGSPPPTPPRGREGLMPVQSSKFKVCPQIFTDLLRFFIKTYVV